MPYLVTKYTSPGHTHFSYTNMPKRHGTPIRLKPKRTRYGPRRPIARRRRIGSARPMRSLKTNYRAINVYRFVRETTPQTYSFDIIAQGTGTIPDMGYMSFENLQFNQLPGHGDDFAHLFARYKIDKIVTTLIPMFETATADAGGSITFSPQLEITKVNTKWMTADFPVNTANAQLQVEELAQLQAKSKSLYAAKRPLTLVTTSPGLKERTVVDSSGNEVDTRGGGLWLSLSGPNAALNVKFKHNAVIFAQRVDGQALTSAWKFRVTHKVFFRCSQVG